MTTKKLNFVHKILSKHMSHDFCTVEEIVTVLEKSANLSVQTPSILEKHLRTMPGVVHRNGMYRLTTESL